MTRRTMRALTALVAVIVLGEPACAQVEVVEPGGNTAYPAPGSRTPAPAAASSSVGELFAQIQALQDELMKLRGIVEEQGEELRQLKQQRLDDYMSLDRRISGSGAPAPAGAAPGTVIDASQTPTAPPAIPAVSAPRASPAPGEEPAYQAAYELVRNRQFPEAITAFNDFVGQYPDGSLTGNAHYWLGELYLLDGDNAAAKTNFETLLNRFGDNRKVPDAMFKLGRIYHQEGDSVRAKELLQKVANDYAGSDSSAPRLARDYLQQNF
jgi:tol-pal system protein YbgF